LTPNKPGDLKEAFNWKSPDKMKDQYWPEEIPEFKPLAQKFLELRSFFHSNSFTGLKIF